MDRDGEHARPLSFSKDKRHRGNTQASADQYRPFPRSMAWQLKGMTQRAQTADRVSRFHLEELGRSGSDRLENDLDVVAIATMDREGPSEHEPSADTEVHKLPGLDRGRDLGGLERKHPHVA